MLPCVFTALACCFLFYFFLNHTISSGLETLSGSIIQESIMQSKSIQKMQTDILFQFDDFMQNRLTSEMPVLKMFIDDKLIVELKAVFEKEMQTILPTVLKNNLSYTSNLKAQLRPLIRRNLSKKLWLYFVFAIISSLLIGVLFNTLLT